MVRLVLILVGLVAGTWLGGRRRGLGPVGATTPTISVVIPARDEERTLPTLLASLARQTTAPQEVVVVDDGSTDGTAAVAAAHGARVLEAPTAPPGWLGKPWACHVGAAATSGTHLLFVDADVTLAPDAVGRIAGSYAGGLLSVQPEHRTVERYEELSLLPNVVALLGTGAAAVGGRPRMQGAFGPCVFTAAADYRLAGGHAAVHDQVVEDLALGAAYREAGLPVDGRLGLDTVGYRMYPAGFRQLVEGWTKNLAAGAGRVGRAASLGATAWVAALAGSATWLALRPGVATLALYVLAALQVAWLSRRVGTFRWWTSALFPVALVAFVALFVRSATRLVLGRPVTWRGRTVPVGSR